MLSPIKNAFQDPKRTFGLYGATYSIPGEDGEERTMTHLAGDAQVSQKLRHVAATQNFLTTPIKIQEKTVGTYLKDENGARLENLFIKTMKACDITATVMASALFKVTPTCRDGIFTFGVVSLGAALIRLAGLVVGAAACASIIPAIEFLAVAGVKTAEGMKFLASKVQEYAPRVYEAIKNGCAVVGAALAVAGAAALKGAKFVYDQISPYLKPFIYAVAAIVLGAGILAADIVNVTLRLLLDIASSAANGFKDWLIGDIKEAFAYLANNQIEDKEEELEAVRNYAFMDPSVKDAQIAALEKKILEIKTLRDKFITERKSVAEKTTDRVVNSYTVKFFSTVFSESNGYVQAVNNSFTDLASSFKAENQPAANLEERVVTPRDYVRLKDEDSEDGSSTNGTEDFSSRSPSTEERSFLGGARASSHENLLSIRSRSSSEDTSRSRSSSRDSFAEYVDEIAAFSSATPRFDG